MYEYLNHHDAGKQLVPYLQKYQGNSHAIVLALPRGGVPVAYEIAHSLSLPLDVLIVRKIGLPSQPEFAVGALAQGMIVLNPDAAQYVNKQELDQVIKKETKELNRRQILYRGQRPLPVLKNRTVIVVDDGMATGASMRAAIMVLKKQEAAKIVIACPVAAFATYQQISPLVDEFICPLLPHNFQAVGQWYQDFPQVSDEEVQILLKESYGS